MTKKSTSKKSQTAKSTSDETTTRTNAGKGRGFVADDAGDTRGRRERGRHPRRSDRRMGPGADGGFGPPRGRPGGRHRGGRRHRRGDVRSALLLLISESPRHGYELMQAIGERTEGAWTPSPGSVYPALQQLQDEGLVQVEADQSKRGIASLTSEGVTYVEENRETLSRVWDSVTSNDSSSLRDAAHGIVQAARQVGQVGTTEQVAAAAAALTAAQRELYLILATDPAEFATTSDEPAQPAEGN